MPEWHTRVDNFDEGWPGAAEYAADVLASLARVAPVFGIPPGARWSARRFGRDVVVFAEWTLDDEVEAGFYGGR